jgi:TonB family protein
MHTRALAAVVFVAVCCGCGSDRASDRGAQGGRASASADGVDESPVMVNRDLPFRYPASLYARRIQGNVTLRLFVDTDGRAKPESTRIEESSGYAELDSAAIRGSRDLQFVPAKVHGEPRAVAVLFPVYFRHPEASPLPGDTILDRPATPPKP